MTRSASSSSLTPQQSNDHAPAWLMAGGVGLMLLGLLAMAYPVVASASVTFFTGWMMLIGGFVLGISGIIGQATNHRIAAVLSGILLAVAGWLLITDAAQGTFTLTAILTIWLIVQGIVGSVAAVFTRGNGWGLFLAGSLLTLALGLLLWSGWPTTATWVLGLYAGISLMFHGVALFASGLMERQDRNISRHYA